MIVYRIEKNGIGPYKHNSVNEKLYAKLSSKNKNRPSPLRDNIKPVDGHTMQEMFFAFKTEQQLKQWFAGAYNELRQNGFQIVAYVINDKYCSVGTSGQIGFIKSKARVMQTKSIP